MAGPTFLQADMRFRVIDRTERTWRNVAAERYRRSEGEAAVRLDWHRISLTVTTQARHFLDLEGKRISEGVMPAGTVFHLPPGVELAGGGSPAEVIVVYQHPDVYRQVAADLGDPDLALVPLEPTFAAPGLAALIEQIAAELDGSEPGDTLVAEWLSFVIATRILRQQQPRREALPPLEGNGPEAAVRRAVELIETRLSDPDLGLEELAQAAGYSSFHFIRLFRKTLGQSPHQYVLSRRIERAKRLLQTSGLGMGEIARASGFRTASGFSVRFRAATGCKPSRYRG